MPGDGAYFVALVPRDAGEAAPNFATLGGGKALKVSGPFGTDDGFSPTRPAMPKRKGRSSPAQPSPARSRAFKTVNPASCSRWAPTAR